MQFRSLLLLGFCASLALSAPAIAGTPPVTASPAPAASDLDIVAVAAPKTDTDAAKKKKLAADAKAKEKTKLAAKSKVDKEKLAAAKAKADKTKQLAAKAGADKAKADKVKLAAAKAKADEKKKLEASAKARAAEQQKLAAKAKAEKDKQLAAEAKAQAAAKLARAKADEERKVAKAKADKERQVAKAKADKERMIARAKADEERRVARLQAEQQRQVAKAKVAEERRLLAEAKIRAAEEKKMALIRAEEQRRLAVAQAAEAARQAEISRLVSMEVVQTGNNGELRSERVAAPKPVGLFAGLFGAPVQKPSMLAETRALDAALELKEANKKFAVRPEFEPQEVTFTGYQKGTIVIDTASHYLYLVESSSRARRYAIAVGKEGLQFKGEVAVGDKQEWPRWIPTKDMQKRDPAKYGKYAEGMPGGGQNPLGARAIYLYQSGKDTHLRIHGTIAPETIGTDSSNGCFRMINEHVMDLYRRVPVGTDVVIL